MPKTTVNKHSNSLGGEDNVRLAYNVISVLPPSPQSHSCEHGPKAFLKSRAFAFDGLHGFPSVFRFEIVAHSQVKRVVRWAVDAYTAASHFQPEGSTYAWQSKKS